MDSGRQNCGRDKLEIKWDEGLTLPVHSRLRPSNMQLWRRNREKVARKVGDPAHAPLVRQDDHAEYEVPIWLTR